MAKPSSRDSGRFRIYVSDRSRFEFGFKPTVEGAIPYTRESGKPVQDKSVKVAPTEFDTPPPSKKPLGGEGDISSGDVRPNSDFSVASNAFIVTSTNVVSVVSSNSISWNQLPWTSIAGNVLALTMAVNPQVVAGRQSQQITFMCVSNQITLITGSWLTLNNARYVMTSGSLLCLMYQTSNSTWFETSRSSLYGDLGAL